MVVVADSYHIISVPKGFLLRRVMVRITFWSVEIQDLAGSGTGRFLQDLGFNFVEHLRYYSKCSLHRAILWIYAGRNSFNDSPNADYVDITYPSPKLHSQHCHL